MFEFLSNPQAMSEAMSSVTKLADVMVEIRDELHEQTALLHEIRDAITPQPSEAKGYKHPYSEAAKAPLTFAGETQTNRLPPEAAEAERS